MIITQDRTTRFDSTRVQALDAAQSGIDVTLGSIRSSQTSLIGGQQQAALRAADRHRQQQWRRGLLGGRRILHLRSGERAVSVQQRDEVCQRLRHVRPRVRHHHAGFRAVHLNRNGRCRDQWIDRRADDHRDLHLPHQQREHPRRCRADRWGLSVHGRRISYRAGRNRRHPPGLQHQQSSGGAAGVRLPQRPHPPADGLDHRGQPERPVPQFRGHAGGRGYRDPVEPVRPARGASVHAAVELQRQRQIPGGGPDLGHHRRRGVAQPVHERGRPVGRSADRGRQLRLGGGLDPVVLRRTPVPLPCRSGSTTTSSVAAWTSPTRIPITAS